MTTINLPSTTALLQQETTTVSSAPQRILFVGQKLTAGTATAGALVQSVGNAKEEDTLFGAKSILAQMIRRAKEVQGITQMDVIPLADAAGTAATGTIAVTGPASATGTLTVTVGSREKYSASVAVTSGDNATTIGAAIAAAINALATDAPFTAAAVTGTVTVTCSHLGTVGNTIGLEVSGTVAGVGITITAMSGGATDPTLTTVLDVIAGRRYQGIVWQHNFATAVLETELASRFNATNDILDGVAFITKVDTLANVKSYCNALNSPSITVFGVKDTTVTNVYEAPSLFEFPDVVSASVAAARALRQTEGANISALVVGSGGPNDLLGGPASNSMPYFNTPLTTLPVEDVGKGWTAAEIAELQATGCSVLGNNTTGTSIILGEVVTTFKTDGAGNPNTTYKYLETVDSASACREYIRAQLRAQFSQHRLTDGALVPGRKMANANTFQAAMLAYYTALSGANFSLLRSGGTAGALYRSSLAVSLNLATGTVTISVTLPMVAQTRNINAVLTVSVSG